MLKTFESPSDKKKIQPVPLKGNQSKMFIGRTEAEGETPILWPPNVKNWLIYRTVLWTLWERERVGRQGEDKGWYGWMTSPTQWTWIWVNPGSWWWTGRHVVLQCRVFQRVGQDWTPELIFIYILKSIPYVYLWLIHIAVQQKLTQLYKATLYQSKWAKKSIWY